MTTLTIQRFKNRDYKFLKATVTLVSSDLDQNVFVVKDMADPANLPNTVAYLLDIASRVDMTAYTDTPDVDGYYRTNSVSILDHDEHTLDVLLAKLTEDVEENIEKVQRRPLTAMEVKLINSD